MSDDFMIFRRIDEMRRQVAVWRAAGDSIALVPTMGALHEGHLSLVDAASALADRVIVSIFVNPTQFGPNEDLAAYPRQEAEDCAMVAGRGAVAAWCPEVAEMYPEGYATNVSVGGLGNCLCGDHRPGHFDGVSTVVSKLLIQVAPDHAVFGEKDWQQLQIIRRVATDLNLPVTIHGAPTKREHDGLAMSSRNRYLSAQERAAAPKLFSTLRDAADDLLRGKSFDQIKRGYTDALLEAGFDSVDYFDFRQSESLQTLPLWQEKIPSRLFIAARLGKARLIDNFAV